MWQSIAWVGMGGMAGSILRYLLSRSIPSQEFPYATLLINVSGSLLIGWLFGIVLKSGTEHNTTRLLLMTGFCGGFTTFSAFSLECIQLLQQQRHQAVILYILLSVVLALAATFAGIQLSKL